MHKYLSFLFLLVFTSAVFAADNPQKKMDNYIAVFDLETTGKVDKDVSYPLTESIRRALVLSGKYEVIDRRHMNRIFEEQKFQLSTCVSETCLLKAGQLLGVGKIVVGSVSMLGNTYYLSLSLINVESGKIEGVSEDKCQCKVDELIDSSKKLVHRLLGNDRQKALDYMAKINKFDTNGDMYRNFKTQVDKLIESNQNGAWNVGWGLTKNGKPYRLQWINNEFYSHEMTIEEAKDKKLEERQLTFTQYKN